MYFSGVTREQYQQAVRTGSNIDWQCVKCKPVPLHEFISEVSIFEPPADSTHLSACLPVPSTADSFAVPSIANSFAVLSTTNSFTVLSTTNSFTVPSNNSSMPSLSSCDFDIYDNLLPSFNVPGYQSEDSFDESLPICATALSLAPLEYHIIPAASNHGKQKLTDSVGYSYTVKRTTSKGVNWQCTQQNPKGGIYGKATVIQRGDTFEKSCNSHECQAQPGIPNTLVTKRKIKGTALTEIFTSAAEITEKILVENVNSEPTPSLPVANYLAQSSNHYCQHFHPMDPTDLDFDIAEGYLPEGFLCSDITVGNNHHLIFVTNKMIELFSHARNWFIDATFKIHTSIHPAAQHSCLHQIR